MLDNPPKIPSCTELISARGVTNIMQRVAEQAFWCGLSTHRPLRLSECE